jgi:hypothetical protein
MTGGLGYFLDEDDTFVTKVAILLSVNLHTFFNFPRLCRAVMYSSVTHASKISKLCLGEQGDCENATSYRTCWSTATSAASSSTPG